MLGILTLLYALLQAAPKLKTTGLSTSTACGRVALATNNAYQDYLPASNGAAMGRSSVEGQSSDSGDGSVEMFTSDIFLYPAQYIVANGHKVEIWEEKPGFTTIWIDENNNNSKSTDEMLTLQNSVSASVYLYAGSDETALRGGTRNISITMRSGSIGAIFAGGYHQNVEANRVDINILGGSVHYVDCGGQTWSYGGILSANSISVLLRDCKYRSNIGVSTLDKNSFRCPNVTVLDFSDHIDEHSFTRTRPAFNNYVTPLLRNILVMGGHLTIPAEVNIQLERLVLDALEEGNHTEVNNQGSVSVESCEWFFKNDGVWTGNEVELTHKPNEVDHFSYSDHTRKCSTCNALVEDGHTWVYSTDNGSGTHTKKCSICEYGYTEHCEYVDMFDNNDEVIVKEQRCKYCQGFNAAYTAVRPKVSDAYCTHTSGFETNYLVHHHYEMEADGLKEYDMSHRTYRCKECKTLLPYSIGSRFFATLQDACQSLQGYTSATITMNGDAFYNSVVDTIFTDGTITLDMNGCDIMRQVYVKKGKLVIKNSKFTNTGQKHYAHFTSNFSGSAEASVTADGCHFSSTYVGSIYPTYSFGDVKFSKLYISGVTKLKLDPNQKYIVENRLYFSGTLASSYLPKGFVFGEQKADGTWHVLYDRSMRVKPIGTSEKTGYVALMPCPKHKVVNATSNANDNSHTGTCSICGLSVKEPHDMTAGKDYSVDLHQIKCSKCNYCDLTYVHEYDVDGLCMVDGCNHRAEVKVYGSLSPKSKPVYFSSFDEAFVTVNNPWMYDTIVLLSDQTNHLNTSLYQQQDGENFDRYYASHIYIDGNGHTLYNEGKIEVSTALYHSLVAVDPDCYALDVSKGTRFARTLDKFKGARGYKAVVYNDDLYHVVECDHKTSGRGPGGVTITSPTFNYIPQYDVNGNPKPYHERLCALCRLREHEEHTYGSDGVCTKTSYNGSSKACGISEDDVIAARVITYYGNVYEYYSLTDAWNYAFKSSHNLGGKVYTIQVLKDIKLEDESSSSLTLGIDKNYPLANIVLNATDDDGVEHTITGWRNSSTNSASTYVIDVNFGHLTIKSGIYQGYAYGIHTSEAGAHLTIEGGTFKNGKFSTSSTIYDGLRNADGIMNNIPKGYVLFINENTKDYQTGNGRRAGSMLVNNGDVSSFLKYGNGEVMPCPHANIRTYEGRDVSCTTQGLIPTLQCPDCGYRRNIETGEEISDRRILPLGHNFVNDVCSRCGNHKNAIVVTKYNSSGSEASRQEYDNVLSAFNEVETLCRKANRSESVVMKLNANVSLDDEAHLPTALQANYSNVQLTIDLNDHTLDLNKPTLTCVGRLIVKIANGTLIGSLRVLNSLILDKAHVHTSNFEVGDLSLNNQSGITFDGGITDNAHVEMTTVSMEDGCWMEGIGSSSFILNGVAEDDVYEYDLDEAIVDLAHTMECYQLDCNGSWVAAGANPKGKVAFAEDDNNKNKVSITSSNNKPITNCYRWVAVKEDVDHTLTGRYCSVCKFNTQHYLLRDRSEYTENRTRQYKGVNYRRNLIKANGWEPLYIPVSIEPDQYSSVCDVADIYSFGQICDTNGDGVLDGNDDTWLIVDLMTPGSYTDPNYPYLIRARETSTVVFESADNWLSQVESTPVSCSTTRVNYSFYGVNSSITLTYDPNTFVLASKGKLNSVTKNVACYPQRWYMKASAVSGGYNTTLEMNTASANGIRVLVIGEDMDSETALQLLRGETVEVLKDGVRYTLDGRKATNTDSGIQVLNGRKILVK